MAFVDNISEVCALYTGTHKSMTGLRGICKHTFRLPKFEDRYSRCAVVGASGTLLDRSFGAEIDAHDAVFRINKAPAGSYWTRYVGNKTTWRVMSMDEYSSLVQYPRRWLAPPRGHGKHTSMLGIPRSPLMAVTCHWPYDGRCTKRNMLPMLDEQTVAHLVHPERIFEIARVHFARVRQKIINSGFIGIAVARALCDVVDVYGFADDECMSSCYHYYECARPEKWFIQSSRSATHGYHDFAAHVDALREMGRRNDVRIHSACG